MPKTLAGIAAVACVVFVGFAAGSLVACKKDEPSLGGGLPPSEACKKIETLQGGTLAAAQKDECLGLFASFGPNMKVCMDGCVTNAKTDPQFKDCSAGCAGKRARPPTPPSPFPPPPSGPASGAP